MTGRGGEGRIEAWDPPAAMDLLPVDEKCQKLRNMQNKRTWLTAASLNCIGEAGSVIK